MKRAARTLGAALVGHAVFWVLALVTTAAARAELVARGVDHLDPEAILEMFIRDGLLTAPARVVFVGLAAAVCVAPLLEIALALSATRARSLGEAFRDAVRLTPASLGVMVLAAVATCVALGLASLAPWGATLFTERVYDDRARAAIVTLAATPVLAILLGFGVTVDVARLHLASGARALDALARGLRATLTRLAPIYAVSLALGVAASVGHAWMGRTNDASTLIAGGALLFVRPIARAAFMLVASRHELRR
jgi:hypothetical protein